MNSECIRIADQLRRAFSGDAWHGPPLRDLLADVTDALALSRPFSAAHNMWELILHIDVYVQAAIDAARGGLMPEIFGTEKDWPSVGNSSPEIWAQTRDQLLRNGERLATQIESFSDSRLADTVPGHPYSFYHLFHGIVQHSLYHAGQIAMLKRAAAT
jgi:hypothetical protein